MYKKQMKGVTFEPKTFTMKFKSQNSYVKQYPSLNNFYQRQKITKESSTKKQLDKLAEAM